MLRLKPKKIQLPSIEDDNIMEDYILLCDMKAVENKHNEGNDESTKKRGYGRRGSYKILWCYG